MTTISHPHEFVAISRTDNGETVTITINELGDELSITMSRFEWDRFAGDQV